jgi:hypothetical protein
MNFPLALPVRAVSTASGTGKALASPPTGRKCAGVLATRSAANSLVWSSPHKAGAAAGNMAARVCHVFRRHRFSAVGSFCALWGFILALNTPARGGTVKSDRMIKD